MKAASEALIERSRVVTTNSEGREQMRIVRLGSLMAMVSVISS